MIAAVIDEQTPGAPALQASHEVRPWAWVILALIVIVGAGLRLVRIGSPVYELDEYWHAELSTGRGSIHNHQPINQIFIPGPKVTGLTDAPPWWRVWTHMDDTVHPPMYPLALRLWRATFGESSAASRSLGAVASIISIVLLFDLVRRLHGTSVGLWAAAIFAVASPQIALARTLRGYTFGIMLIIGAALLVVMINQNRDRSSVWKLAALFFVSLAALLTYYFAAFAIAAIGLYALIQLRGRARAGALITLFLAVIVFVLVWLPGMRMQSHTLPSKMDPWIYDGWAGHVKRTFTWFASLPSRMLSEPRDAVASVALLGASLYIIPAILLWRRRDLLLWILWLWAVAFPLLALDLLRDTKHLYFVRYALAAGPPVYALLATMLQHLPRASMRHAIPLVSVVACLLSIGSAYEDPRREFDALGRFIDAHRTGDQPIVIYAERGSWFPNAIFLTASHESRTYPWPVLITDHFPLEGATLDAVRASGGAIIVTEGSSPSPSDVVPGIHTRDWTYVPNVCMILYATTPAPSTAPTSAPAQ